jgi:hypothetical protein
MTSPAALFAPPKLLIPPAPPASWWDVFDPTFPMVPQSYPWTCSICATTWVLNATSIEPDATREQVAYELGYPSCVNPAVGLASTQCVVDCFQAHGVGAHQEWVDWNRAYDLCSQTTGVLNSTHWYHFVGIRGVRDGNLWVANSAPGYDGIWDDVTPGQFQAWAGSWQIVWLSH